LWQVIKNKSNIQNTIQTNSLSNFLFALKAPESKRQYPRRLKMFFDFGLNKNLVLEEQANLFLEKASREKNARKN